MYGKKEVKNKEVKDLIKSHNMDVENTPIYAEIYASGNGKLFSMERQEVEPKEVETTKGIMIVKHTFYQLISDFKDVADLVIKIKNLSPAVATL